MTIRQRAAWFVCVLRHHDPEPLASVSYLPIVPGVQMQAVRTSQCRRCGRRLRD
jgi:hypothetical protein